MAYTVLERELQRAESVLKKERRKSADEQRRRNEAVRGWEENENVRSEEKLRLSDEVFAWSEEFTSSKEYRKASKLLNAGLVSKVDIYSGGWGHELPEYGDYGCWSHIYLRPDGSLEYKAWYKWMGPTEHFVLRSPEELVKRLDLKYIKGLSTSITSGRVWKYIGERLDLAAEFGI